MITRIVTLGSGRTVTLGSYVAGINYAKANPNAWFADGFSGFGGYGREEVRAFRRGMHERITLAIPRSAAWPAEKPALPSMNERRVDRKLMKHLARTGRECKWCGSKFTPKNRNEWFCEPSCRKDYYNL